MYAAIVESRRDGLESWTVALTKDGWVDSKGREGKEVEGRSPSLSLFDSFSFPLLMYADFYVVESR